MPIPDLPVENRWKQQLYPAPIVAALIRRRTGLSSDAAERYLLIKRNGDPYNGLWALVGGKWEFGETLEEAIIREVKEETNLESSFTALRGIVSERLSDKQNGAHFLLFVCEVMANEGHAKEQNEGALSWFTKGEIQGLHNSHAIIPSDFAMIDTFAESASEVPHIEAEMLTTNSDRGLPPFKLTKFEQIG